MSLSDRIQDADWKKEKHVPVIEPPTTVKKGEPCEITVSVGREIAHPNVPEHFIAWIKLFFQADEAKFPVEIGDYQFSVHGSETDEAAFPKAEPKLTVTASFAAPGTLMAMSYCNIHGLWQGEATLEVE